MKVPRPGQEGSRLSQLS